MKTLNWFKKHEGEVIYRDDNKCPCPSCKVVLEKGLMVFDPEYLYTIQNDYANEGIMLNYRDKR